MLNFLHVLYPIYWADMKKANTLHGNFWPVQFFGTGNNRCVEIKPTVWGTHWRLLWEFWCITCNFIIDMICCNKMYKLFLKKSVQQTAIRGPFFTCSMSITEIFITELLLLLLTFTASGQFLNAWCMFPSGTALLGRSKPFFHWFF